MTDDERIKLLQDIVRGCRGMAWDETRRLAKKALQQAVLRKHMPGKKAA